MLQNATAHRLARRYAGQVDDGSPLYAFAHYGRIRNVDDLLGDLAKRAESASGISSARPSRAQRDLTALLLYVKDAASWGPRSVRTEMRRFIKRGRRAYVTMWEVKDDGREVTQGAQ